MNDKTGLAPIALFAYNRKEHLEKTVDSLKKNKKATDSQLFIFSDGPKSGGPAEGVDAVRKYIRGITGFKTITVVNRDKNIGLARSIISGVTETLSHYGRVIVLEDDLIVSPFFLDYMNEALEIYETDPEVICVHAYSYPLKGNVPETYFIRGADCWGWGTWKRGWELFEPDGKKLLGELLSRRLGREFDFNGSYPYTRMLEDQIGEGTIPGR